MATDIFRRLGVIGYGFHSRRLVIGCACACLSGLAGSAGVGCACLLAGSYAWGVMCYAVMVRADIFLNLELQDYMQFLAIARNTTILLQFSVSGSGWVWLGALALKSIFCGSVKK